MKIKQMIRMQAAMVGVAAGLFLASAAPAQEITNTEWQDRPGAMEAVPATPVQTADTTNAAVPASQPVMAQEAAAAQRPAGGESVAFLLIGIVGVVLYAQAGKKRAGGGAEMDRNASLS